VFDIADWELDVVVTENHTAAEYCLLMGVEHLQTLHMIDVKSKVEEYWGSRRASGVATATAAAAAAAAAHSY